MRDLLLRRPGPMSTKTILEAEYQALRKLHAECVRVRDANIGKMHALREWNRLTPGIRLAVVELDALYREQGSR